MNICEQIKKMRTIQSKILEFVDKEDDCEEHFGNIIQQIKDQIEEILSKQEDESDIKQLIQSRDILLPSKDEDAQESIRQVEDDLNEIKDTIEKLSGSQKIVIDTTNIQSENIRQIKEKLNELDIKQQAYENNEEEQIVDDNTHETVQCLKYEMKRIKKKYNDLISKQEEMENK